MVDEATVRRWLSENGYAVSPASIPGAAWSLTFKLPTGLQLAVQQPNGRRDMIVVSCGLNVDPAQKKLLERDKEEFLWELRRDFILKGVVFQFNPPTEGIIPDNIGVARETYTDGLNKNYFMRAVLDVQDSTLLTILRIRHTVGPSKPEGYGQVDYHTAWFEQMFPRHADSDILVQAGSVATGESEDLDFKSEWGGSDLEWEEIVRDLVAMANTSGGLIAFGCESDGTPSGRNLDAVRAVDQKDIHDKVRSATSESIPGLRLVTFRRGKEDLPAWFVPWSRRVIVFTRDSRFPSGSTKNLRFYEGQVFWRHGSSTERATATDIDSMVDERVMERMSLLLGNRFEDLGALSKTISGEAPPPPAVATSSIEVKTTGGS